MSKQKRAPRRRSKASDGSTTDITPAGRTRSALMSSTASLEAYKKRATSPLILPASVKLKWQGLLASHDVMNLRIDQRYQREEVANEVNMLIRVLMSGGQIPDPVTIVERRDGSRYIVDGQQRWWAHVDTGKPMHARVFACPDFDDEVALFHILNTSRRVSAAKRLESWPKAAGVVMRWICLDPGSPLAGLTSYGKSEKGGHGFRTMSVLRGITSTISGLSLMGSIDRMLDGFDKAYERNPKWADAAILRFAKIASVVFSSANPMQYVIASALGKTCYTRWKDVPWNATEWPMPSERQLRAMARFNWHRIAGGIYRQEYLPMYEEKVRQLWSTTDSDAGE